MAPQPGAPGSTDPVAPSPFVWTPGLGPLGPGDLTLFTDEQLRADVTPNPWREHERLATGKPGEIGELAATFARAGGDLDLAYRFSTEAQELIGGSFTNNNEPVYSPDTHFGQIPRNFPDSGTQLTDLARRLDTVADDLDQRTKNAATTVDTLVTQLDQKRRAWAIEVKAAFDAAQGLSFLVDIPGLTSRRDALRAEQRTMVSQAGSTAQTSVGEYERGLHNVMRMLADIGYVPPESVELGPGDLSYTADTGAAAADDVTKALETPGQGTSQTDQVDAASEGVALLNAKIAAGGTLDTNEAQFLQAYYDRLASSGSFAELGGTPGVGDPTRATVANGLMNLSQVEDGKYVPASVHGLLNADVTDYAPNGGRFTYEGTSNVITHATADGGTTFTRQLGESALHKMQDQAWEDRGGGPNATIGSASDMKPMNDLLRLVARDTEASQAMVGNREDRHTLLGAPGQDTSGAAAVLTSATKPAQETAALATRSAELSRDIFVELGNDPRSWREVIPKGGDVSDAITQLAADRMDTFAYSGNLPAAVQPAQHNADDTWTASVRLNSDRTSEQGDDRIDFLKFVASGSDLDNPRGDRDMQALHTAANDYVVQHLSDAMRGGGDVTTPLAQAGNLSGVIARGQFEALVDESVHADQAAARAHSDENFAITLAERIARRCHRSEAGHRRPVHGLVRQGPRPDQPPAGSTDRHPGSRPVRRQQPELPRPPLIPRRDGEAGRRGPPRGTAGHGVRRTRQHPSVRTTAPATGRSVGRSDRRRERRPRGRQGLGQLASPIQRAAGQLRPRRVPRRGQPGHGCDQRVSG